MANPSRSRCAPLARTRQEARRGMKGIPSRRPSVPTTSLPTHRRRSAMSAVRYCWKRRWLKAAVVHLTQHHMLPAQRTAELMGALFDLLLSDATVLAAVEEARQRLEPTVTAIGQAISAAPIAHADETGLRVNGKLHWLHVLATGLLTWMGIHPHRGKKAFDAFGLLRSLSARSSMTAGSLT